MYARFFSRALTACGYWDIEEPFQRLFTQGMVCHKTYTAEDGRSYLYSEEVEKRGDGHYYHATDGSRVTLGRSEKMSKSKCNFVSVDEMLKTYGTDRLRLFLLSDTPPEKDLEWSAAEGIEGCGRCLNRFWTIFWIVCAKTQFSSDVKKPKTFSVASKNLRRITHNSICHIERAIEGYHLNKYITLLREFAKSIHEFMKKFRKMTIQGPGP